VDADFEQHYQAAERAYGLEDYAEAHALALALWDQLQSASNEHDPGLILGWRAVVSLLLGHIQLHGLQQPEQAAISYERVLVGDVDATIAALAEQGLERCRAEDIASEAGTTPATNGAIPDLLKDPFLSTEPDQARPATADLVTAMPWLTSDEEPRAMPTADPSPTATPVPDPVPSPEPKVNPEANADVEKQEPEPTAEELPLDTIEAAPQPKEPAATDLL
jgi:outer membrane biosynthesis protein TonB